MKWLQWRKSRTVSLFIGFLFILGTCGHIVDPYRLLGVHRTANLAEIRRAYKQLAKEWHPDKNENPDAETKFVEIKQAYEILSDPERRKLFDMHGITDEDSVKQKQDYSFYGRFNADPLDELFGSHGGRFHFQDHDITVFHKMSVTTRQFENNLVPNSQHTAHLVLFYTDWCFPCLQAVAAWRKMVETLEPLGVALATVHAGREPALARKVGVVTLPALVLLLDGRSYVFQEQIGSIHRVTEFIRSKLPVTLAPAATDATVTAFLSGWRDNRVRALLVTRHSPPRLRYLLVAYHFRERVAFALLPPPQNAATLRQYKVNADMDTVLVFNENVSQPLASVSMQEIPAGALRNVIEGNQFLRLPRLSSQRVFELLCPAEWSRSRKRLCVVLVTGETREHDWARDEMRRFVDEWGEAGGGAAKRVKFVYLYRERQPEFVEALWPADGDGATQPLLRIVIVWRRDTTHVHYEWLQRQWQPGGESAHSQEMAPAAPQLNDTKAHLQETLSRLLKGSEALSGETTVKDLMDEHARGPLAKFVERLLASLEAMYEGVGREQVLPLVSVLVTVGFIVVAGYFMAYLVRLEEENIQKQKSAKKNGNNNNDLGGAAASEGGLDSPSMSPGGANSRAPQRELYLHELRAEKYNGLVRLLKPGCRTIVLFVDAQSRLQLIPEFHKIVWPYRKNKTLMFAHMSLERGLSWYRELLQLSLPEPRALNINPRNCVGTVLALNGHRKYFCMFHAKHAEAAIHKKNKPKERKTVEDPELGAFIGFESDTSESEDDEVLLQGTLLDSLPNWLDRLFEGSTRRYYINYWPDFPTK